MYMTEEAAGNMQAFGEALASSPRWEGYCDGLKGWERNLTAFLLENQYQSFKQNFNETTKVLQIGNWDKFAFPIIRAVNGGITE
jgi:hypothetical protein